ncbi:MAG: hypothetical protein MZW92_31200 [Comamonadaceae bacterium]|nr:hypothetical protein [Comamonadaceae bacterium]
MLRLNGIGIVEESGLRRIVPIGEIPREPAPVGIGRNPEDVKITGQAVLQDRTDPVYAVVGSGQGHDPFLSKTAVIIDIPKSNYIAIVDTDSNVRRLLQLIDVLDSEQLKKIKPEVFVYPVQNGKAKDLATLIQQIFLGSKAPAAGPAAQPARAAARASPRSLQRRRGPRQGGRPAKEALVSDITRIFADEITNAIIILATPDDYELIADTIRKIDIVPRQVIIEGLIVRVDLTDNFSLGFAYSFLTDMNLQFKQLSKDIPLQGGVAILPGPALDTSVKTRGSLSPPAGPRRASSGSRSPPPTRATPGRRSSRRRIFSCRTTGRRGSRWASRSLSRTSTTASPVSRGRSPATPSTSTIQYKDIGIILGGEAAGERQRAYISGDRARKSRRSAKTSRSQGQDLQRR